MMNRFKQFLLLLAVVTMASFTWVPPTHHIPERNRAVAEVVWELPGNPTLTLTASSSSVEKGGPVCVSVTARDFQQILSMQFSMKWDASVLKFREVRGFGLPALAAANFGAQLAESHGALAFSWYDPNLRGLTKPDGAKLYEVCFDAVGQPGSQSSFEFGSQPTVVEIANSSSVFLQLKGEGGLVKIEEKKP